METSVQSVEEKDGDLRDRKEGRGEGKDAALPEEPHLS